MTENNFGINQAKYKPFRIQEILKPQIPGQLVMNLSRRIVKVTWMNNLDVSNYNALRLMIDQNFELIRATLHDERELRNILRNSRINMPESRRNLFEWLSTELNEEKAAAFFKQIDDSQRFSIQYVK